MSSMIKQTLFTNWHTMRWVALAIGIFFATLAIVHKDILTGILSAFFFFQAIANTGCMVAQTCGVPAETQPGNTKNKPEPEFTEIKN